MDGLGLYGLINSQQQNKYSKSQQFSRLLSLGMNIPPTDHHVMTFESNLTLLPEAPGPSCPQPPQIIPQNVTSNPPCVAQPSNPESTSNFHQSTSQSVETNSVEGRNFVCDKCDKSFDYEDVLAEHLRCYHKVLKPYICRLCNHPDACYRKKFHLNTHLRKEHNFDLPINKGKVKKLPNGFYACDLCDGSFENNSKAYIHRLRHFHPRHICVHCQKSFYEPKHLKKHMKTHENNFRRTRRPAGSGDVKRIVCRKYGPKRKRNRRKKGEPKVKKAPLPVPKDETILCQYCSQVCTTKAGFRTHLIKCLGGNVFPCFLCESIFDAREGLHSHLKDEHNNQKPMLETAVRDENGLYKCPDCEAEGWAQARHYYKHRLEEHGEKRITCSYCEKGFFIPQVYKHHLQMHTKERKIKCTFCNVGFAARQYLLTHMANNHFRYMENSYYCKTCNKVFAEETFKQHRVEHEGKSAFMCNKCYQGFDEEKDYVDHRDNYHVLKRERKHVCKICNKRYERARTLYNHNQNCHRGYESFECKYCFKKYGRYNTLKSHYKICTKNVDRFELPCKAPYRPPTKAVVIPANVQEIEIEQDFVCKFCLFPFAKFDELKHHSCNYKNHFSPDPSQHFICCFHNKAEERDYTKEDALCSKEPLVFIQLMTYFCQVCLIPYHRMSLLEYHVSTYHKRYYKKFKVLVELVTKNQKSFTGKGTPAAIGKTSSTSKRKTKKKESSDESDSDEDWESDVSKENSDCEDEEKIANSSDDLKTLNSNPESSDEDNESDENSNKLRSRKKRDKENSSQDHILPVSIKTRSSRANFVCKICNVKYVMEYNLEKHIRSYHPNYPEGVSSLSSMADIDRGSKEISQDTDIINASGSQSNSNNAKQTATSINKNPLLNDTTKNQALVPEPEYFTCRICNVSYIKQYNFKRHVETNHPNFPEDACREVQKSIDPEFPVSAHDFTKTAEDDDFRYNCKICHLPYKRYDNLLKHINQNHEEYFLIYPDEKLPEVVETPTTENQIQDSNATDIVDIESESQKDSLQATTLPSKQPVLEEYHQPVMETPRNAAVAPKLHPTTSQHLTNHQQPSNHNSHVNHHFNHLPQPRNSCLYQQAPHHVEHNGAGLNNQGQAAYQHCFMPQNQLPNHQMNSHVSNFSPHSNYIAPSDTLRFLDGHLPRHDHVQAPTNSYNMTTRVDLGRQQPHLHNTGGRPTYFDNNTNQVPVNDFSYWDRVISQPLNISNDTGLASSSNYNPPPTLSFNVPHGNIMSQRNSSFPVPAVEKMQEHESDGDNDFAIPDTGFGVNYDDSDSCDNPKNEPKETDEKDTSKGEGPEKTKYVDQFLQFTKTKQDSADQEVQDKDEKSLNKARENAFFCVRCPMYYLRDYFLDRHYQTNHPEYWKELEAERLRDNANQPQHTSEFNLLSAPGENFIMCKFCEQAYSTKSFLLRHYKKVHAEDPEAASVIEELSKFIESQKMVKENLIKKKSYCDICDKSFIRELNLKHHQRTVHLKERPYSCQYCSKSYTTRNHMHRHEENVHLREDKQYICSTCEKEFQSEKILERHCSIAKCSPPNKVSKGNAVRKSRKKRTVKDEKKKGRRKMDVDASSSNASNDACEDKDDEEEPVIKKQLRARKTRKHAEKNDDSSNGEDYVPLSRARKRKVNNQDSKEVEGPSKVLKLNKRKMGPKSRIIQNSVNHEIFETSGKTDSYFHDQKIVNSVRISVKRVKLDTET